MSEVKQFDPAAAARYLATQNKELKDLLFDIASHVTGLRAQVDELASKLAAKPQAAAASSSFMARTGRDAKTLTNRNGKEMVFLNIKHDGEYMDLIVSGKHAIAAARLGEGSKIQYELSGQPERKPAVDREGAPILNRKTGQQIINISAFAEHFKIIEAEPIAAAAPPPRDDYADFGAPRAAQPRQSNPPPPMPDFGNGAEDDIPF